MARLRSRTLALLAGWVLARGAWSGEPFDYFANSWSVLGLKDYTHGARITPSNEVLLAGKARLSFRFASRLTPLSRRQTKTCLDGWPPVVLLSARDGNVSYDFTLWATPLPTVRDWRKAFGWPTEGENFLVWALIKATNTGQDAARARLEAACRGAGRSRERSFAWELAAGQSAEALVRVPFAPVKDPSVLEREDPKLWLERTVAYWRGLMAKAARVEVPSREATEALLAAHVCQLLVSDHGELHGGEGFYDTFFVRDGAYQLMELEEAGLWDSAAKAIACFLRRQRPDGRFETQKGQLDANGQALWALWQYYKITGDRAWLAKVFPQMLRAAEWTKKARRQAPPGSPFAGLLPAAPADGEHLWDGKHHIVGYDFWNLRGLLCTADAARALGRDASGLEAEAADYRAAINAAWKRTGLSHFPPSWEKEGTHWGNTETLWPTEILPPEDPRLVALIEHARHKHGGGFVEGTIRWTARAGAIHPYLSAYTTMASLVRGEHERVVEDFHWYLLHSTATHAFPEGIYYKRRFAWSNTIPHPTGAANYALMLRHMLVHERGEELHLLPAAPDWWLGEGKTIRIERAPTHFGPMSLHTRGTARGVEVSLVPPRRNPPARIILHLPKSRPLVNTLNGVTVVTRKDQSKRWDFPTVVRLYHERAPHARPIPGLVALPVGPLRPEQCVLLDLAGLANTDPFTAPFGVPQAKGSRYLFTGMPVGVRVVGGVPFRITDPAKNGGKGLVVLHSPRAPKHIEWPREVEIPVGRRGKRLFFLGNVHGWNPDDEGAGEWGAVAEYVIHYADGTTQTVPLIAGRTTDDWVLPPAATEAHCALRSGAWHLNVLGVALRPARVEKIVFRDLGTSAAALLVAVTLEE